MRAGVILFTAWMLGASAATFANGNTTSDLGEIHREQISYRQQAMDKAGPFKDISEPDRQALIQKQNQLITLIEGKRTLDDLARDDQTTAINTLEWIKAAITRAEDERLVCERIYFDVLSMLRQLLEGAPPAVLQAALAGMLGSTGARP